MTAGQVVWLALLAAMLVAVLVVVSLFVRDEVRAWRRRRDGTPPGGIPRPRSRHRR